MYNMYIPLKMCLLIICLQIFAKSPLKLVFSISQYHCQFSLMSIPKSMNPLALVNHKKIIELNFLLNIFLEQQFTESTINTVALSGV